MASIDQLDQFLSENPDIEIFEVLLHDLNGAQRGKWLPRDKIHKLFTYRFSKFILTPKSYLNNLGSKQYRFKNIIQWLPQS